jgi:hypothetical protein
VELGFNFQEHPEWTLVDPCGHSHMKRPLTTFHGSQVKAMFAQQQKLWRSEQLVSARAHLEKDKQVGVITYDLKLMWEA